jgi:hypothetical protein
MPFSRVRLATVSLTALSALVGLAMACGGGKNTDLTVGEVGTPPAGDGGSDAAAPSGSSPLASDAGPVEQFNTADSAPPGVTFDCQPGTYSGTFETTVTSDAGGLLSLYSLNIQGTLSIAIVGQVMQGTGEIPTTTYSIAPGAQLTGVDKSFNGTYAADLVGQLDCASKTFTGTLDNALYHLFLDAGTVPMEGSLMGTYGDGEGGVPTLSGTMFLTSPNLPSFGAVGPWSATLQ